MMTEFEINVYYQVNKTMLYNLKCLLGLIIYLFNQKFYDTNIVM